jgi:hypothetical protein
MSRLTGKKLYLKSDQDDTLHDVRVHEARDGMQFHYDTCGCEEEGVVFDDRRDPRPLEPAPDVRFEQEDPGAPGHARHAEDAARIDGALLRFQGWHA